MAHHQKSVAAAAALNTAIFVVEAIAGLQADSLSLIMDSIHNFSDELALLFLFLAFVLPRGVSRMLLRSANLFNSVGLVLVSGLLLWQAIERLFHPVPVAGMVPIVDRTRRCRRQLGRRPVVAGTEPKQRSDPLGVHSQHGRRLRVPLLRFSLACSLASQDIRSENGHAIEE